MQELVIDHVIEIIIEILPGVFPFLNHTGTDKLSVENDDRPGNVGVIGTLLGAARVNIADMALSRNKETRTAVTVIEVDNEPSADLLAKLRATPGILRVLSFEL